jgi:hypothetical protein
MKNLFFAAMTALLAMAPLAARADANATNQRFVLQTYRANLFEIREARDVMRASSYPGLREFAQTTIDEQSLANVRLRAAARVAGVTFPDLATEVPLVSVTTGTNPDGTMTTVETTTTFVSVNPYGPNTPTAVAMRTDLAAQGWVALDGLSGSDLARQYWRNAGIERYRMLDMLNDEVTNGSDPRLRALASQLIDVTRRQVSIVQQHLDGTWER